MLNKRIVQVTIYWRPICGPGPVIQNMKTQFKINEFYHFPEFTLLRGIRFRLFLLLQKNISIFYFSETLCSVFFFFHSVLLFIASTLAVSISKQFECYPHHTCSPFSHLYSMENWRTDRLRAMSNILYHRGVKKLLHEPCSFSPKILKNLWCVSCYSQTLIKFLYTET